VGLGWTPQKRDAFAENPGTDYANYEFELEFIFEEELQKFPRIYSNETAAIRQIKINYVDFGLMHRKDVPYPPVEIPCSFEFLDYNYFSEQYAKVTFLTILITFLFFFKYFFIFRIRILPLNSRAQSNEHTPPHGLIFITTARWTNPATTPAS
jgi:hypothetical protein